MLHDTPLRDLHLEYARRVATRGTDDAVAAARPDAARGRRTKGDAVEYLTWGPPDETGMLVCEVPATFGAVEAEYAVLRREGAGLLDCPHRGTIRIAGDERIAFLERMLTQRVGDVGAGGCRESFWLTRTGRIAADLLLVELGDEMLVDVDVHQAASTVASLDGFVIAEDVAIEDVSASWHRLAVHGRAAVAVVGACADESLPASLASLAPLAAARLTIAGTPVVCARRDQAGVPGIELFVARDAAAAVWQALLDAGGDGRPVRPIGWYAFNVARIEAGTPLFNIDFGVTNLPHETSLLDRRVSFTKGCYLGQEVVARMQSLGRPKQVLVGLRLGDDRLPHGEAEVYAIGGVDGGADGGDATDAAAKSIGVVTSSTLSPMLGAAPIAFAMVRAKHAEPGSRVSVDAEGSRVEAEVVDLRFWSADGG